MPRDEEPGRLAPAEEPEPPGPHRRRCANAAVSPGVVRRGFFAGELLERDAFRLGDEERYEESKKHEEREYLCFRRFFKSQ